MCFVDVEKSFDNVPRGPLVGGDPGVWTLDKRSFVLYTSEARVLFVLQARN